MFNKYFSSRNWSSNSTKKVQNPPFNVLTLRCQTWLSGFPTQRLINRQQLNVRKIRLQKKNEEPLARNADWQMSVEIHQSLYLIEVTRPRRARKRSKVVRTFGTHQYILSKTLFLPNATMSEVCKAEPLPIMSASFVLRFFYFFSGLYITHWQTGQQIVGKTREYIRTMDSIAPILPASTYLWLGIKQLPFCQGCIRFGCRIFRLFFEQR